MMSSVLRCLRRPVLPSSALRPQLQNNPPSRTLRTRPRRSLRKQRTPRRTGYALDIQDSKIFDPVGMFAGSCMFVFMGASVIFLSPKIADKLFVRYVVPFFQPPYIRKIEGCEERIMETERRVERIGEVLGNMTDDVFRLEKEVKELKRAGCKCKCQGGKGDRE